MRFDWLTVAHSPSPAEDHAAIEQQLKQRAWPRHSGSTACGSPLLYVGRQRRSGGAKRNRLFMASSPSLYSVYMDAQGVAGG